MAQSWSIIILIFSVFPMYNTGFSAPEKIKAFVGGSAVFPCNISKSHDKTQDVDVHWRNRNGAIIYSIIRGKGMVDNQDPQYKNRVEYFPEKNCSIKLNKLSKSDNGSYYIYISDPVNIQKHFLLNIADKQEEITNNGRQHGDQKSIFVYFSASILIYWIFV